MYSAKFINISKTKISICFFFSSLNKYTYYLFKFHTPLHATRYMYHIKPVKRVFDSKQLVISEQFILPQYFGNGKNTCNVFEVFPHLRISTALSTEVENGLYLLFLIQNSVVTNSKQEIAGKKTMIICNCDLMIKLRKNGP